MELEAENWRLCSTTLVRGVAGELEAENWRLSSTEQSVELEAENWRLCSTTLVRGVAVELEAENWRVSSTTLVRGAICGAGSRQLRTGDFVVQI